ncbi:MAG: 3-hydroxyisobutyrate dehydrogenase [Alphaproteobacteria bacterium]
MASIGFIGIGNMGGPMAQNLLKAGHEVTVFDLSVDAMNKLVPDGAIVSSSVLEAAAGKDVVISMLPAGAHVKSVYLDNLKGHLKPSCLVIDCSTIDVSSARDVNSKLADQGIQMVDAPVSGGNVGAAAGTLTFMCGGSDKAMSQAKPYLEIMGKTIVHAGGAGNGQAAKICNNMMLAIQMISVCEGFKLADKLGLDRQKLFDISSTASGNCWSLSTYCPVPGPVPTSPANKDYVPGFSAHMMLKDIRLAMEAAESVEQKTTLGKAAAVIYETFVADGYGDKDFSGVINAL